MIIGSGMLAKIFSYYATSGNVTIFASGVSASNENRQDAFLRERNLLEASIDKKLFIYFSTTSILDPLVSETPYVRHKIEMENLIRSRSKKFLIFRLSQVSGIGGNPNTLVNALASKILKNEPISIYRNATRNIINAKDVQKIVGIFIANELYFNKTINIATPWDIKITTILDILEEYLKLKSKRVELDKGFELTTDIALIKEIRYSFYPDNPREYLLDTFKNIQ
jgi:nucleoside-diphosphate-sugar epimerase